MEYWISNADSFLHQIFMIVMGSLYGLSWLLGISYKAVNIYSYFVMFPLSFMLFLKGWKKYLFLPTSLLFFLIPGIENISSGFFDHCVVFLNKSAELLGSNYVAISVYLCVLVPLLLYLPFIFLKLGRSDFSRIMAGTALVASLYLIIIYPNMKDWLIYLQGNYI